MLSLQLMLQQLADDMTHVTRRGLLAGGAAAVALTTLSNPAVADSVPDSGPDGSHATPELRRLVTSTFRDKTSRNVDRFLAHFSRHLMTYTDGTLGSQFRTWQTLYDLFAQFMPGWPATGRSYPTRIIGDARSGIVLFTDSPELFGSELRIIAPIDFRDGKIVREVDYWDGRHFGAAATGKLRTPKDQFPTNFGEGTVGEQSPPVLRQITSALATAFAAGDAAGAAELFTVDAAFEDLTLHTTVVGQPAIRAFLSQSLDLLPYGPGTSIRHVVGGVQGGGYEWTRKGATVDHGIVAVELDRQARVSRLTTVWDGSLVDDATITAMLVASIER